MSACPDCCTGLLAENLAPTLSSTLLESQVVARQDNLPLPELGSHPQTPALGLFVF